MPIQRGAVPQTQQSVQQATQVEVSQQAVMEDEPPFEADAEILQEAETVDTSASEAEAKAALEGTAMTTAHSTSIAPVNKVARSPVISELAESGFEDLTLGFGAFPIIKLENEGIFADTDGNEHGKEFDCIVMGTRAKYAIKNTRCEKKDETVVYSYDLKTLSDDTGTPLQEIIDDWAESGWGYTTSPYLEASAQLVGGEQDGEMVFLSVPKASKNRLSGHLIQTKAKYGLNPNQYITRCSVGDKVQNTDFPFYPWKFSMAGRLDALEA